MIEVKVYGPAVLAPRRAPEWGTSIAEAARSEVDTTITLVAHACDVPALITEISREVARIRST